MKITDILILVIDDEELVRENVVAYFEDEGASVREAESGEDAIEILKSDKFDIAIVDMRLPGMNGNAVIINAHKLNPAMKFIIHTGSSNYVLPDELFAIGMNEECVIRKPVKDMNILRDAVMQLVQQ